MTIFVDIDGVLADFTGAVLTLTGHTQADLIRGEYDLALQLGMSEEELWERVNAEQHWWENLPLLPHAKALMKGIEREASPLPIHAEDQGLADGARHEQVYLLTTGSRNPDSLAGKARWIARHFSKYSRRTLMGRPKACCAQPDALLIDDRPRNFAEWCHAGGHAILFPTLQNSNHMHAHRAKDYTLEHVLRWTARAE